MPQQQGNPSLPPLGKWGRRLWLPIYGIVAIYLVILIVEEVLRTRFGWDLCRWPESPFMINMMKLNSHLPVYSNPSDVNSFVYSPGLEYLIFGILKPFGLALDIRFCRLVNILFGMLAAALGARVVVRLLRSEQAVPLPPLFTSFSWGVFWLMLSKNVLSDVPHPDNLHQLHAVAVLWLCFAALESGRFKTAMATMIIAGLGVFTKQTEAVCLVGPLVAFACYNKWGWRRWCLLAMAGTITLGLSLYLVWLPKHAKFYTLYLLSHQPIELGKITPLLKYMCSADRGLLLFLTPIAVISFWLAGGPQRRYLICWAAIGVCSATPNFLAFLKVFGTANNLSILEFWMTLLVWPGLVNLIGWLIRARGQPVDETLERNLRAIPVALYLLLLCFLGALLPLKEIPHSAQAAYCRAIDKAVSEDVQGGKKVLVTQGAEFYIHAGGTNVPLDQANSALELRAGGQDAALSEMQKRIRNHYYDKIYLRFSYWLGGDLNTVIDQCYKLDSVIPRVSEQAGGQIAPSYMEDCKILSPRQ